MKIEKVEKLVANLHHKTEYVGPTTKTYSYLIDDRSLDKKAKGTKKCVIKIKLKFEILG